MIEAKASILCHVICTYRTIASNLVAATEVSSNTFFGNQPQFSTQIWYRRAANLGRMRYNEVSVLSLMSTAPPGGVRVGSVPLVPAMKPATGRRSIRFVTLEWKVF